MKNKNEMKELKNKTFIEPFLSVVGWKISVKDLLLDLKSLIKEYFLATFTENDNELKLNFANGQSFIVSVKGCE